MTLDPAHRLALRLARSLTGADEVRLRHACPVCGADDHGVPYATADSRTLRLSVSRAAGVVAAAADLDAAVGIDIEVSDAARFAGFAAVALHPDEPAPADAVGATRLWVRKEAVLKALGSGLRVDPRRVRIAGPDAPPAVLEWPDPRPPSVVELQDLDAGDGYLAALAVIGGRGAAYTQVSIRPATSASA